MQNNTVETLIGAVVVVVAIAFVAFTYSTTSAGGVTGYEIAARFGNVDGISVGTDVRLHGIKIGAVSSLALDQQSYMAKARLSIRNDIKVPEDSSVKITSSGLLGGSYVAISPGGSDDMLKPGDEIHDTQGAVDLMGLVGRFINGGPGGGKSGSEASPATPPSADAP